VSAADLRLVRGTLQGERDACGAHEHHRPLHSRFVRPLAPSVLVAVLVASCAAPRRDAPAVARDLRPIPLDLSAAEAAWRADPDDLDARIWYGRRLGYEGRFEEAVALYGEGLARRPGDAELLRHRGHRLLSLRRFDEARADLERAAAELDGRPDSVELDGAPNPFEIPRGTLHTNVWYHLGLAYHCLARDDDAARAFAQCLALATNDDFRVAAAYWRALALVHLGRSDDARALAALYAGRPLELMESADYATLLALLAGADTRAADALAAGTPGLSRTTLAYGVALWHRMHGREVEARALLEDAARAEPAHAFARIAAEVELERMAARTGSARPVPE